MLDSTVIASPIGNLKISANTNAIVSIDFTLERISSSSSTPLLTEAARQLNEYFCGKRTSFDLPLAPEGTEFQKKVWKDLETIPYGETRTYKEMALMLGAVRKVRASASANGRNPIPIIIPCHRVIGSDGSLTGYSGGLDKKTWLLKLEQPRAQLEIF